MVLNRKDAVRPIPQNRWAAPLDRVWAKSGAPDRAVSNKACLIHDFAPDFRTIDYDISFPESLDVLYHLVLGAGRDLLKQKVRFSKDRAGVVLASIALPTEKASALTRHIFGRGVLDHFGAEKKQTQIMADPSAVGPGAEVTGLPAALLARVFGLKGRAFTLDAACASSLFAVKLACDELLSRRADAMIAGGACRPDSLYTQVGFSQLMALSPSGRCAPFDHRADGLVVGEGVGLFLLKRLQDAIEDRDEIWGVIRGIGLSNDMGGNLLAPEPEGQMRAMTAAYQMAEWSPHDVDLVECHGAGTRVGDRAEAESLRRLWGENGWKKGQCAIGSVKSNLGHLLTAAGAAGMAKVLMALKTGLLPPSLHFSRFADNSPLKKGPFRVQTQVEKWNKPKRKAAVSAFGFGGINAHLLLESHHPDGKPAVFSVPEKVGPPDAAIVGMDVAVGDLDGLFPFEKAVFSGKPVWDSPSKKRMGWASGTKMDSGAFIHRVDVHTGEFRIMPGEIPDILPQQLLLLRVGARAMKDAGFGLSNPRPRMGAVIGLSFDYEAADYHLRWDLEGRQDAWLSALGLNPGDPKNREFARILKEDLSPPLTAPRVLGALGSIAASRVAREFKLGGPCFTVSSGFSSGLTALDLGGEMLARREVDAVLVGAVDLFCDPRRLAVTNASLPLAHGKAGPGFTDRSGGPAVGEGACALVLIRKSDARASKRRIYAFVKGTGAAAGELTSGTGEKALARTFDLCDADPDSIDLVEGMGSGDGGLDGAEAEALSRIFGTASRQSFPAALGAVSAITGITGAASGLVSVAKAALALHRRMIPAYPVSGQKAVEFLSSQHFYFPARPCFWSRDKTRGPRRALVQSLSLDGVWQAAVLEQAPDPVGRSPVGSPLGNRPLGLFAIFGNSVGELNAELDRLVSLARQNPHLSVDRLAARWHSRQAVKNAPETAAIIARDLHALSRALKQAKNEMAHGVPVPLDSQFEVFHGHKQNKPIGDLAFVFPGSGNHFLGMGRELGRFFPDVLLEMNAETDRFHSQLKPEVYDPRILDWRNGWEKGAMSNLDSHPVNAIFGQVVYGCMTARILDRFRIRPKAVLGYSLGESTAYFSMNLWPDRGLMLERMEKTDLFTTQLAGPCLAARSAWNITENTEFFWRAAVVRRPAREVEKALAKLPPREPARLLIVNTDHECVIGGRDFAIQKTVEYLKAEALYLDGVVTVHCDALNPVADAYRELHRFPATPPAGIRFYSAALAKAYEPDREKAADSILNQARFGFDFTKVVRKAHEDGVRIFLEMGPHNSCTRMIHSILKSEDFGAVSVSRKNEPELTSLFRALGTLISLGVEVDLDYLYGQRDEAGTGMEIRDQKAGPVIRVPVGGGKPLPVLPEIRAISHPGRNGPKAPGMETGSALISGEVMQDFMASSRQTARAHEKFLEFSRAATQNYANAFNLQARLLESAVRSGAGDPFAQKPAEPIRMPRPKPSEDIFQVAYDREACLEFAVGSAEKVLGKEFAPVDTYRARVRLPDEPLMLVDRILSVEGTKGKLGPGRVVTEHDVLPDAWYLDGGAAPLCIAVEAGQADLFLCAWMGIDLLVKGERTYRLLDATVRFHRGLPVPGETVRYDIHIQRFARQGETRLFFFNFRGEVDGAPLITMTGGCAGFFTPEEQENSGGIILTAEETKPLKGKPEAPVFPVDFSHSQSLDESSVDALRKGDLSVFGPRFSGKTTPPSLCLPSGRMRLIHRVKRMDPHGGRYGMGHIQAVARIHPEDWFLTCHFVDDKVMPGTLMYECCAHALRILLLRMGWAAHGDNLRLQPVLEACANLKCRGPVTPRTREVVYEVELKETGADPFLYALADAHMIADGRRIVKIENLSLKIENATVGDVAAFWEMNTKKAVSTAPVFSKDRILEFCSGSPSRAFGPPYAPFDADRFIARLPRPPYLFMEEVVEAEPAPWELKPGGWIRARCDLRKSDWHFAAHGNPNLAHAILMEIALQPCGWLAAYMGSALRKETGLHFRNLGGVARQLADVPARDVELFTKARLTDVSESGDMIIQSYEFGVTASTGPVYEGKTVFGFFSQDSLAHQKGIREKAVPWAGRETDGSLELKDRAPLDPHDDKKDLSKTPDLPAGALKMVDRIETLDLSGGPGNLGYIRGIKDVDPKEWFFHAHFFQDPVCPGSLGVDGFLQLLKYFALRRFPELRKHRFAPVLNKDHTWTYRGQVLRKNKKVAMEAVVTGISEGQNPVIMADGRLYVDGMWIYKMENFGIHLEKM